MPQLASTPGSPAVRRRRQINPRERGMVTFELATGLLAATILTVMLGWCISLVSLQARCQDTAYAMARQVARGDDAAADQALHDGPAGAQAETSTDDGQVRVVVSVDASIGSFGPVRVQGEAIVTAER